MKKAMKVLALLLALTMAMGVLCMNAFAANDSLTVVAECVTAEPGATVDVSVDITANPGVVAFGLSIEYDENVLTLNSVTDKGVFGTSGATVNQQPADDSCDCYVLFEKALSEQNITATGNLLTLHFAVADNAAAGDYTIELAVFDATNTALSAVNGAAEEGKITVKLDGDTLDVPTVENQTGTNPSATVSFSEDGKTMNVKNDAACVVLVKKADGTYEKLSIQEGDSAQNSYNFDVSNLPVGASIVVAVKGDANGDGKVTVDDAIAQASAWVNSTSLGAALDLIADVDGRTGITLEDAVATATAWVTNTGFDW